MLFWCIDYNFLQIPQGFTLNLGPLDQSTQEGQWCVCVSNSFQQSNPGANTSSLSTRQKLTY